jgi:cellulose biosynthesis protein BcsQ/tetratricopeptide (TPR) repeat protein
MSTKPPDGRVITFYSYKGGVGRTMTLANVAQRLAEKYGLKVIAVDWDLEAPGLHPFFGILPETAARTRGVLDYFVAWRDAVTRNDPEPPPEVRDITPWLLPIEDAAHKPHAGSISVLLAGQQDETYDERLGGLYWQSFYAEAGGALAVEKLREQLVSAADVVLVDSRTGLTDAGGICTIQIPDGVVLMTAPSEQSLEGTESIARTIAGASARDRAERNRVRVWLAVGRFSSVEETILADRWFEVKSGWFEKGVERGLWLTEDHPKGLRSHVIPHRGRWNFGEAILREGEVDAEEPLMRAYAELTGTLGRWLGVEVKSSPSLALRVPTGRKTRPEVGLEVAIARLPATGRDLFGREAELAWLDACWSEGVRVASIVGWGGAGKSAMVNEWLRRMDRDGWRGVTRVYGWSFYSQGTDRLVSSDEFFSDALRRFGDTEPPVSPWEKGERLAALVRKERTLLILDGVEPLQWGPGVEEGKLKDPALMALVKELGAQNMGLCVITSRVKLTDLEGVGGDKVRAKVLAQLSPEAGAELLKARGAKGTKEELRQAAEEYKGHGLALTLLGSYLADVADGDIRRRKEIGPLEEDERGGGHARRVMTAYEKWLGEPEVAILHMIGLFDGPADEDEIAALRAEPVVSGLTDALTGVDEHKWKRAVAKLRRVGLLAEQDNKRLDAHPLVRQHFGEQLKREQPEAWREGHRRLYEYLKKKARPLPETLEEMAPLYAAVVQGCLAGKSSEAFEQIWLKRIQRKNEYFSVRKLGVFGSEVAVLSAFFDPPWERLAPGLSEADGAGVLSAAGFALRALGRLPEAAGLVRLSLERYVAQENWMNAAIAASNLSALLQDRGELSEAVTQAQKSIELADKSTNALLRLRTKAMLAAVLHAMGLLEVAAAQFEEAERMQKEIEPEYSLLYSLSGFRYCDILLDQGLDAAVRERAAKALVVAGQYHWLLDIALSHLSLGRAHLFAAQRGTAGDLAQAASHIKQAVDGLRHAGDQSYIPLGLLARTALHTHTRAFDLARRDLDEVLTLATRSGFRLHEADAHLGLARLAVADPSAGPAAAREHLARARAIIEATGYHRRDGELAELAARC